MAQDSAKEKHKQNFEANDVVLISNLKSKVEYNGLFGNIIKYIPRKSRYYVTLSYQKQKRDISIKAMNLSMVYAIKYSPKDSTMNSNNRIEICLECHNAQYLSEMIECPECRSVFHCKDCSTKCIQMHSYFCTAYKMFATLEYGQLSEMDQLFSYQNVITYCDEYGTYFAYDYFVKSIPYLCQNKGIWQRYGMHQVAHEVSIPFGELDDAFNIKYYKSIITNFNEPSIIKTYKIIKSWKQYFRMKNITLESPIAHFMSWIMSVYYALTQYIHLKPNQACIKCGVVDDMKHDIKTENNNINIIIHLLGVEVELDLLPLYQELLYLLPGYNFIFYLFGNAPEISKKYTSKQVVIVYRNMYTNNYIKFRIYKCEYGEYAVRKYIGNKKHRLPHIVIGLNIGLSAEIYGNSWNDAILYIRDNKLPAVFTENFCNTIKCNGVKLGLFNTKFTKKYIVNPFRSPIITFKFGTRFSQIENGFICALNV